MTEKSINSGTACSIISRFPLFGAFSPSLAPLPRRIRLHPFSALCYTKGRFPAAGRIGRQKSRFQLEKERNKKVVYNMFAKGYPQEEISEILNLPFSKVKKWCKNFSKDAAVEMA